MKRGARARLLRHVRHVDEAPARARAAPQGAHDAIEELVADERADAPRDDRRDGALGERPDGGLGPPFDFADAKDELGRATRKTRARPGITWSKRTACTSTITRRPAGAFVLAASLRR